MQECLLLQLHFIQVNGFEVTQKVNSVSGTVVRAPPKGTVIPGLLTGNRHSLQLTQQTLAHSQKSKDNPSKSLASEHHPFACT
jgi:hypothetical protein